MHWIPVVAIMAAGLGQSPATAQTPLLPEQAALIEQTRAAALRYSWSLPNFICTQIVHRSETARRNKIDPNLEDRRLPLDKLTVKLSYFDHKEDYELQAINGRPTKIPYSDISGAISAGEFGSSLLAIFLPASSAEFQWKGTGKIRKRNVAVFTYHVSKETSTFRVQYGGLGFGQGAITVAYHGEISVDAESHMVLRLIQEAELPAGFPITRNSSQVDYNYAPIGGTPFLLPVTAHITTYSGKLRADNEVEFRDYRKFHADSTINFGGDTGTPPPPADKK